jgi:hypothetical protein
LSEKANGLFDLILQDTNLRAMYLRRLRTVMDLILSSDASRSWIDLYAQQLLDRVAPDAVLDSKRYAGSSVPATDIKIAPFDPNQLRNRIEQRRRELYDTAPGHFGSLIPSVQHDPVIQFAAPEKADTVEQSATVLMNCGSEAVDISNWSLQGGEGRTYQVRPGVVIPGNGGRLYVTPNVSAFRAYQRQQRNVEILGLFVQGGFDARLLGVLQVGNFVPATLILRNGATIVATNQAPLLTCP